MPRACTCTRAPLVITLAGEPRGKGRHRSRIASTGDGRTFIRNHPDAKTQAYEGRIAAAAQVAMAGRPLLTGPLVVAIWAHMGVPASLSAKKRAAALAGHLVPTKKPDFDNLAKICDALNKVVWTDDALIVDGFVSKRWSDRPRLVIRVEPWVPTLLPPPPPSAAALPLLERVAA